MKLRKQCRHCEVLRLPSSSFALHHLPQLESQVPRGPPTTWLSQTQSSQASAPPGYYRSPEPANRWSAAQHRDKDSVIIRDVNDEFSVPVAF